MRAHIPPYAGLSRPFGRARPPIPARVLAFLLLGTLVKEDVAGSRPAVGFQPYTGFGLGGLGLFSPALFDTFATITRLGARLSPGVLEFLTDLEPHMRAVADTLGGSR